MRQNSPFQQQVVQLARSSDAQRLADFFIGVPCLLVLRTFRRPSLLPKTIRRIGVICPTAIGDLILATGLLARIQQHLPHAEIHLFHGKTNAAVLPLLPVPTINHECNFGNIFRTIGFIRDASLDVIIDITPWPRITALMACLSRAVAIGYRTKGQFRHFAFDLVVPHLSSRHELDNLRDIADLFGRAQEIRPFLIAPDVGVDIGLKWDNTVLCHPCPGGSRAAAKQWPHERWAQLTDALVAKGYSVCFTGSSADTGTVATILSLLTCDRASVSSLCGAISLSKLSWILQHCRLLITVDTGIMHLGSVVNAPLVALMGPTLPSRWGPRSNNATTVQSPHSKAGYIDLGFERCSDMGAVMQEISVDDVISAVEARLARPSSLAGGLNPPSVAT